MNTQQAKEISLMQYLAVQGIKPIYFRRGEHYFLSPLREEKQPSFIVKENAGRDGEDIWNDFGLAATHNGGDIVEFVKYQLNADTSDALKHLADYANLRSPRTAQAQRNSLFDNQSTISIVGSPRPLHHFALLKYLREVRKIPDVVSKAYLKVVWYKQQKYPDRKFFAFGWRNESGAYELRAASSNFKSVTGKKDITYIPTTNAEHKTLFIFEGILDFLSALVIKGQLRLDGHVIVLNSTAQLKRCFPYVQRIQPSKIVTFMDNDDAGRSATTILQEHLSDYPVEVMTFYEGYKDVNAYLVEIAD